MTIKPRAAVIGDPINHSLSPKLHNFWLQKYHINGSYEAIHVKAEELDSAVKSMVEAGYAGFNVTIPHKEKIFQLCQTKTAKALLTKAANTITISNNHTLIADNSDCDGFLNNLKFSQPNFELKNQNAFLIGAGGAARAIVYTLINSEVKNIFISNRNAEKAQNLIADFQNFAAEKKVHLKFLAEDTFATQLENCDLLINSTSLGMQGQPKLKINLNHLKKTAIVYDIVYKPLITELLKTAQSQGNQIVTGLGMLAFQGMVGFENWFGKKPEIDEELLKILLK